MLEAPLQSITSSHPFEKIGIDMLGPLPLSAGKQYIIVCTDYFTRWAETRSTKNQKATTIARFIIEQIMSRHGSPKIIISDQGRYFISKIIKEINYFLKTDHYLSSPYHPQTNGLVEKTNQTLTRMITHYVQENPRWDLVLPMITFAYNTANNTSTKASPFYLIYGREPKLPIDVAIERQQKPSNPYSVNKYLTFVEEQWPEIREMAMNFTNSAKESQKFRHDRDKDFEFFREGDKGDAEKRLKRN
uniref:Integrase catalytic domain-containing protein n=1 Tax=Tetranychus urticae TaxID=32264 RepID=A0A158P5A6_TETUR